MLPPFQLGIGGPVAGGRQYISWIHAEDLVGIFIAALADERWEGPVNATAPEPVTNRDFSRALGRALHRPALLPVPGLALRALYGEMAEIVTSGARVVPAKPLVLGYPFQPPGARRGAARGARALSRPLPGRRRGRCGRARRRRAGARAQLPAASASAGGPWPLAAAARFSVSMITRQGRLAAGRRRSGRSAARRAARGSSTSR